LEAGREFNHGCGFAYVKATSFATAFDVHLAFLIRQFEMAANNDLHDPPRNHKPIKMLQIGLEANDFFSGEDTQ